MSDRLTHEVLPLPAVPREILLAKAEGLFSSLNSETRQYSATNAGEVSRMFPPELREAISLEYRRASREISDVYEEIDKAWAERSLGKKAVGLVLRQKKPAPQSTYNPRYDESGVHKFVQAARGWLPLYGEDNWPRVDITLTQSYLDGNVVIAGEDSPLNPDNKFLAMHLDYIDENDGRTGLLVDSSLSPFNEGVAADAHTFGSIKSYDIPHVPFINLPADPSVYMMRAMEMLLEKHVKDAS